ncbi:response regulator [Caenimonas koreensis]|uniref:histidine kinase n=1 Tax=Caenimonas koreensis DSM 17982 TaxID=1121255 RepID=A0A844B5R2_9BURK|nr:hybrid sensor histidine kinase/response regulator [Caenimonas koreensis]MRD48532.1 response regulator [Caenimonas koreensis DSM 17982]
MKRLPALARDLMRRHRDYHELEPLMLLYAGIFGAVTFPLLYMLRFTKADPVYDDLLIRVVATSSCILLMLRKYWPKQLLPYFHMFSYWTLVYSLPFTFMYIALKNGGGTVGVANTLMVAFFVILMTDWRNMIAMLSIGFGTAIGWYVLTDPNPKMPVDYVARLPTLLTVIVGGSLFKIAVESATSRRVRDAYASLAGSIAHEMRNPLSQVRHSLEQIRAALPAPTVRMHDQTIASRSIDTLYRHVSQGELAVKRGLQVIAMTMDEVSARGQEAATLDYLKASEACDKAIQEYGYENEQQRARVSLEVLQDFTFRGDETAFLFVLFNLLKNALFYMPAYPYATVRFIVERGTITVRDTGPGIPESVVGELFQPFGTRDKKGGTGLGLAYCRRVTQAFGGEIACRSVLASFTEFVMTFPVVSEAELEASRQQALADARRQLAGRNVLLVDDDAMLRTATRQKLVPMGCVVFEAADGAQALMALRAARFDLVLLDLNMPQMDGYEVAELIRRGGAGANRDTCLIAHTSEPEHLARVKTTNAGFDDFVSKPVDDVTLARAMCEALRISGQRAQQARRLLAGRRILVADDNAYNRSALGVLLRHEGAQVVDAASGGEALEILERERAFDAILLDIEMPGMDGIETARRIRAGVFGERHVPIIAITGHSGPDVLAAGGAAGIEEFILKPVEPGILFAKLSALLGLDSLAGGDQMEDEVVHVEEVLDDVVQPQTLLDERRLQNYLRIGMLSELVNDYRPLIDELVVKLLGARARNDFDQATRELHSIVGMSGEVGASGLYRYSRELYIGMLDTRQWPRDIAWTERIRELTAQSNRALVEWSETHDAASPPDPSGAK